MLHEALRVCAVDRSGCMCGLPVRAFGTCGSPRRSYHHGHHSSILVQQDRGALPGLLRMLARAFKYQRPWDFFRLLRTAMFCFEVPISREINPVMRMCSCLPFELFLKKTLALTTSNWKLNIEIVLFLQHDSTVVALECSAIDKCFSVCSSIISDTKVVSLIIFL